MAKQPTPDVIAAAKLAMSKYKIPASVQLAQWALESAWGTRMPAGSNNPFGIKARIRDGALIDPHVIAITNENYVPGSTWRGPQPFRKFDSIAQAFDYHGSLLGSAKAYAPARSKLPDIAAFCRALTGVYATDPAYDKSLMAIINASHLTQYDRGTV